MSNVVRFSDFKKKKEGDDDDGESSKFNELYSGGGSRYVEFFFTEIARKKKNARFAAVCPLWEATNLPLQILLRMMKY